MIIGLEEILRFRLSLEASQITNAFNQSFLLYNVLRIDMMMIK